MKQKILDVLNKEFDPRTLMEINDLLGLKTAEELNELQSNLEVLENELELYKTRKDKYILFKNAPYLKVGNLSMTKKDFGFVIIPGGDDLYIGSNNLNGATHDDKVLAEVIKNGFKTEGRVIKVLKREFNNLVGEIIVKNNKLCLLLDEKKKDIDVILTEESLHNCVAGSKVLVRIIKQLELNKYLGEVITIIGHKNDPGVDILSIAFKYGIHPEFPSTVLKEIDDIATEVLESDKKGRKDLSNEVIFTIDGDDTKDIDDAISIKKVGNNYVLGVHIADVSYYVKKNSPLDEEAYVRGTSSYLADTVIPMLPHKLSNGICSLNPGVLRLAISCVMDIDCNGKVINYDIFPSIIKSRIQMTYKKVNDIIVRNIIDDNYKDYVNDLKLMDELSQVIRKNKVKRGYIDFELEENKIIQDSEGRAIDVVKRTRERGENIIEDFMIVANETVATHIFNMKLPFIYRVHDVPNEEKINDFLNLIKILGYRVNTRMDFTNPSSIQKILEELSDKEEYKILSSMLLRSMKKAEYSINNIGHFGLASRCYTHFTSPIRRYPDLNVHRCLRDYLFDNDLSYDSIKNQESDLNNKAMQSSEREVAAVSAERDVVDIKSAEYMEGHIGEEFDGMINTVTNYGFYVELDNLIEGLVHVTSLKKDYFNYVPELLSLIGNSTKKTYRLGDKIRVKVVGASKEAGTIDFEVVGNKDGSK